MEPIASSTVQGKTFTPVFSQSEDRIRLIVNYADYHQRVDLWITRAFVLKLIPSIEDCLDRYAANEAAGAQAQKSESAAQSKTDMPTLAMTEKEGHLVQGVDITFLPRTRHFRLVFKTASLKVETTLNAHLLRALLKSIFAAVPKIDWGISPGWVV